MLPQTATPESGQYWARQNACSAADCASGFRKHPGWAEIPLKACSLTFWSLQMQTVLTVGGDSCSRLFGEVGHYASDLIRVSNGGLKSPAGPASPPAALHGGRRRARGMGQRNVRRPQLGCDQSRRRVLACPEPGNRGFNAPPPSVDLFHVFGRFAFDRNVFAPARPTNTARDLAVEVQDRLGQQTIVSTNELGLVVLLLFLARELRSLLARRLAHPDRLHRAGMQRVGAQRHQLLQRECSWTTPRLREAPRDLDR